jgi:hypothetical protein
MPLLVLEISQRPRRSAAIAQDRVSDRLTLGVFYMYTLFAAQCGFALQELKQLPNEKHLCDCRDAILEAKCHRQFSWKNRICEELELEFFSGKFSRNEF